MQYGWWIRYRINRPLRQEEGDAALSRERQSEVVPSQRMGLIRINSTYIDWIDPAYAGRGMFNTAMLLVVYTLFALCFILDFVFVVLTGDPLLLVFLLVIVPALIFFWRICLRYEFGTYTHYPIRLNRKTRKIHVFRHPRKGGLLTVPWDEVFFHVGDNGGYSQEKFLHNIRGQILDGDNVIDTFSLGHDAERMQELYDRWEFIKRYMDEGPEAVASDPLDEYVELSVSSGWNNCLLMSIWNCDADTVSKRFWRAPFIYWFAATRWLIFKTCKEPVFPPEVEAESTVAPDDPNIWPIPAHTNQFDVTVPGVAKRSRERMRQTRPPGATKTGSSGWPARH